MVHLTTVPNDSDIDDSYLGHGLEKVKLEPPREDGAHVSVYGSRFAAEELPRYEMPEHEMPKEIAYRMIRDDLSLDGNPMLNLASFVTTYMVRKHIYILYIYEREASSSLSLFFLFFSFFFFFGNHKAQSWLIFFSDLLLRGARR